MVAGTASVAAAWAWMPNECQRPGLVCCLVCHGPPSPDRSTTSPGSSMVAGATALYPFCRNGHIRLHAVRTATATGSRWWKFRFQLLHMQ